MNQCKSQIKCNFFLPVNAFHIMPNIALFIVCIYNVFIGKQMILAIQLLMPIINW